MPVHGNDYLCDCLSLWMLTPVIAYPWDCLSVWLLISVIDYPCESLSQWMLILEIACLSLWFYVLVNAYPCDCICLWMLIPVIVSAYECLSMWLIAYQYDCLLIPVNACNLNAWCFPHPSWVRHQYGVYGFLEIISLEASHKCVYLFLPTDASQFTTVQLYFSVAGLVCGVTMVVLVALICYAIRLRKNISSR